MRNYAIVLAGGRGSRMGLDMPKQYIELNGYPLIYYSLRAFQNCGFIDEIILVTLEEDIDFCRQNIVNRYGLDKVSRIAAGGKERYESVFNGLAKVEGSGYVFIHDGARPCINLHILHKIYDDVQKYKAAVAAVPSKDTVKISDVNGFVKDTPDRGKVWIIQTPQVFDIAEIKNAYNIMQGDSDKSGITDDAMVMEKYGGRKVHLCEAFYCNIKVTTLEDIYTAENYLKNFSTNL